VFDHRRIGACLALVALCLGGCATPPSLSTASVEPVNDPLSGWVGDYDYQELLGSTEDEQAESTVDYHITITSGYVATVSLNGFQTMANLLASVNGDANSVTLVFTGYTGDNLWQPYTVGDELLTLAWQDGSLVTTWGALKPQLEQDLAPGQYFQGDVG